MMLQGHFTDTLLAAEYRDLTDPVYATWSFMRGMTAPIFFFASGLIFVFLLVKSRQGFWENKRVQKGAKRGFQLILIGYLLRMSFPMLLSGHFYTGLLSVDVLHCIGIALWCLIICYYLSEKTKIAMPVFLAGGAFLAFLFHFDLKESDWSILPLALANYFTSANGSVFTPIPWVAYSMTGGILGYALSRQPKLAFNFWVPLCFLIVGVLAHYYSHLWLNFMYEWTGIEQFYRHANFNFLLWRLGHVFIVVSIFMWIAQLWKKVPQLLLKIGGETLIIYEVHYVLLYSTWFGIGLSTFWYRSLTPLQTVLGAAAFVLSFVIFIAYLDKIRSFNKHWVKPKWVYAFKFIRIMTVRWYRSYLPILVK
jgi:hypothetical protein